MLPPAFSTTCPLQQNVYPQYLLSSMAKELEPHTLFYARVGYIISRWAYIDRNLFEFCRFILRTSDRVTSIIFYRTPNIGDHITLTDNLMKSSGLHERHIETWALIAKEMNKLLPVRNELAHNPVSQVDSAVVVLSEKSPNRSRVISSKSWTQISTEPMKVLRMRSPKTQVIKDDDLEPHIRKIERLEEGINYLRWQLLGRPVGLGPTIPEPEFPPELGQD
jgi:hypothetical protein